MILTFAMAAGDGFFGGGIVQDRAGARLYQPRFELGIDQNVEAVDLKRPAPRHPGVVAAGDHGRLGGDQGLDYDILDRLLDRGCVGALRLQVLPHRLQAEEGGGSD